MPLASDHVHASCRSTLKPSKAARRCCPLLETTLTALSIRQALSSALKIERWTPFLSSAFDNRRVDCLKAVWKGRRGTDNALADVSADTLRRYPSRLRTCTGIHASRNICIIVAISVGAILVVEPILTLSAVSRRANGTRRYRIGARWAWHAHCAIFMSVFQVRLTGQHPRRGPILKRTCAA